ncbi:guanine-1-methyltransferase-domain-containing protein [Mucor lusitanicus]|nr:guanine-1-methyltransferase-domain-containing protein [Mucor lusitanicus]
MDSEPINSTIRDFQGLKYDISDPKFEGLSKRAIKRLLRDEQWDANKEERKATLREKVRVKRLEKRRQMREGIIERPPTKKKLAYLSEMTNVGLIVDCGFGDLMTEKEHLSYVKQLGYTYGKNKVAPKAMKLALTSFDDTLKDLLDRKLPTWQQWKESTVSVHSESYMELYDKDSLVYLSADSDNVIERLEEGKNYIIGGIVDKNRYKNLCQDKAVKQGIQTARLPIGNYLQMASRKVLTVNQVCEIMLKWLELHDWQQAFMDTIPGRKLKDVKLIEGEPTQEEEGESSQEEAA